jgi:hypothetical protein
VDDTIPDIIKNYDEGDYTYSLPDYFGQALDPNQVTYKIDKFNNYILNDPGVINEYFHKLLEPVQNYFIDVNDIDLLTRLRTDNMGEIKNVEYHTTFSENRYVFQFVEYSGTDKTILTIFIDGYYYMPDQHFSEDGMKYIYIPTTMVHNDSLIEVNVDGFFSFQTITPFINTTGYLEFLCHNGDKPVMACDIYLVRMSDNAYVDKSKYDVLIDDDFGNVVSVGSNTCRNIHNRFYIQMLDPLLLSTPIIIKINKIGHTRNWVIGSYVGGFTFPLQVNNDPNYFKIYRNGALIPRQFYIIIPSPLFQNMLYIDININKIEGSTYNVQYTSNKFTPLLYLETIPDNGIIEVDDILDRPFDYHTYEYYLNGRKLNYTNIEILTPHTLLVKGVTSRRNFEILNRNIDDSQFFIYGNALTDINSAIYNLPEFQSLIVANFPIIPNTQPTIIDLLDPNSIILIALFIEYLSVLEFINPDTEQFTAQELIDYAPVMTAPFIINPDLAPFARMMY